jgi:hypothetical protein
MAYHKLHELKSTLELAKKAYHDCTRWYDSPVWDYENNVEGETYGDQIDRLFKEAIEEFDALLKFKADTNNNTNSCAGQETMNIYSRPGTKIRMLYPDYGHKHDQDRIKKLGITSDMILTVDYTVVHNYSTELYIKEYPDLMFNVVNFVAA